MRNLAFRAAHRRGDRLAHLGCIEPGAARLLRGRRNCGCERSRMRRRCSFDIGKRHRSFHPGAESARQIESKLGRPPSCRGCHFFAARCGREVYLRCWSCGWLGSPRFARRRNRGDFLLRLLGYALADPRQQSADRNLGSDGRNDLGNDTLVEYFDLDRTLLRFDDGDHIALFHPVAGLLQPLDQSSSFHVGAERRHQKIAH